MLKTVEPIKASVAVQWELHGIGWLEAEGYKLEDGSHALYIYSQWVQVYKLDDWKRQERILKPVIVGGDIVGFIRLK